MLLIEWQVYLTKKLNKMILMPYLKLKIKKLIKINFHHFLV